MKKVFISYTSFTRKERAGMVVVCGIIVLLLIIYAIMGYWVQPATDDAANVRLTESWQKYRRAQTPANTLSSLRNNGGMKQEQQRVPTPQQDSINVNAADSAQLVGIKGISPGNAARIIARRQRLDGFRTYDELRRAMIINDEDFELIKKCLYLGAYKK